MMFWFATIVFFGTYILIATEKVHKTVAAMVGATLMMLVVLEGPKSHEASNRRATISEIIERSIVKRDLAHELRETTNKGEKYEKLDIFARYVNFDVVFTLAGMMLLVNILSGTGIFQFVAIKCAKLARGSPTRTLILLVVATAVLSAFLDNVTTVLLVAPVTLLVATELDVPPIPFLMAETMASNIGGTATLIGDPPNLIIGSVANLNFMAFMINLFPFIIILMTIYCIILRQHYKSRMHVTVEKRARIMELDESAAIVDRQNLIRGGIIMMLTIVGFLVHGALHIQPCVIAMAGASMGMAFCKIDVDHALEKIEWSTLFFFLGLFIIVNGADHAGLMEQLGSYLSVTAHWNPLLIVLLVMWLSAIFAAITNNVSFTAAMVTIMAGFLQQTPIFRDNLCYQHLMWWGLALAVCLGGNGTIVGAAANLVSAGISEKAGHRITFREFFTYGFPVTFFSMIASSVYITIRYFALCR